MRSLPPRRLMVVGAALVLLLAVGLGGFWLGAQQEAPRAGSSDGRTVLFWYDPMVPDQHFDKPGKSPFMDMELVPRYAGEADAAPGVRIAPGTVQNLGVRFAVVERSTLSPTVQAAGTLAYNGRTTAVLQAKQDGFVERSHGRAMGDVVSSGDALVDLRVPAWTGALAEYLSLRSGADAALVDAARRRLSMLGVPQDAIARAEQTGSAPTVFTQRAPISGAVISLDARQGMSLPAGAPIASISGLSPIWLVAAVPQGLVGQLAVGSSASASFPAFPGESFSGRVEAMLPAANAVNRTVELRISLPNADGRLRPGMTGAVTFSGVRSQQSLSVPAEAVIRTGQRNVVIVAREDGAFEPVPVELGAASGDRLEIVSGLNEGQRVVASGQFLIDSEANFTGVLERLRGGSSAGPSADFESTGRVTAIDANGVTIAHAPVPRLNWPQMTMAFGWGGLPHDIKVGDEVAFSFRQGGAGYVLTSLRKTGAPQ